MRAIPLILLCCFGLANGAEIGISQHDNFDDVIFSGEIKQGDALLLKPLIDKVVGNGKNHRFIIHSQGGNVTEAMKIGDLLRQHQFAVFEPQGVSCISACIFAIMGGAQRIINGQIGLHHPLFLNIPNDTEQTQNLLLDGKRAMIEYAVRMKVSPQIVRDMYSLPNESVIKYLNQSEIGAYHLSTKQQ